jgi:OmpA-OmpF porin, OOP family
VKPGAHALCVGLLAVAASGASAQGIHPDAGFYLGGGLGQSKFKEWCDTGGSPIALATCEDTDTSWKLLGGYRFNRYVAAEASYIEWGEVTASTNTARAAAKQHSYGLAAVGTLPIGERFELFGKAGFLMTEQETRVITATSSSTVNRDETELHYGLGAKYAFTRNWALRGEWEKTDKLKVELLSIGVEYRF